MKPSPEQLQLDLFSMDVSRPCRVPGCGREALLGFRSCVLHWMEARTRRAA